MFVLCSSEDEDHPKVKDLCGYAQKHNVLIDFPGAFGWSYYKKIETSIEQSDTLVVLPNCLHDASWSNHIFWYANALREARFTPLPRILALKVDDRDIPPISQHIEAEWIESRKDFKLILEDYARK